MNRGTLSAVDEAAKAERREYFRKWRAANKDKVRKHNADYWQRRAERRLQEQQASAKQEQGDQQ